MCMSTTKGIVYRTTPRMVSSSLVVAVSRRTLSRTFSTPYAVKLASTHEPIKPDVSEKYAYAKTRKKEIAGSAKSNVSVGGVVDDPFSVFLLGAERGDVDSPRWIGKMSSSFGVLAV